MWFLRLFAGYRLLESALLASRREAFDLQAAVSAAEHCKQAAERQLEVERADLRELRIEHNKMLAQSANFLAYAKTGRMIFTDGNDTPIPASAPSEVKPNRPQAFDLVAEAKRQFSASIRKMGIETIGENAA